MIFEKIGKVEETFDIPEKFVSCLKTLCKRLIKSVKELEGMNFAHGEREAGF